MDNPVIDPSAFVASSAVVVGNVILKPKSIVMYGAVLRAEWEQIVIGEESNVQDNCVFHTDDGFPVIVGKRVTVGHAAVVHGARLDDACLIGIGAKVLNGAHIGEGALIAAASLVPEGKSIPAWTLAMGVPAKPVRDLTEAEILRNSEGVDHYQDFAIAHRALAHPGPS